jgi:hypothetical protein
VFTLRSRLLSILSLCLLLPLAARAEAVSPTTACAEGTPHAYISINYTATTDCYAIVTEYGPGMWAFPVVINSVPFESVRLSVPEPPFGTTFLGVEWNFPATGDLASGYEVFTGCQGEGVTVLGYAYAGLPVRGALDECVVWTVADGCEITDCNGVVHPAEAWDVYFHSTEVCPGCFQQCQSIPPYDLLPPDGATNVSLDAQLSWAGPPHYTDPNAVSCSITISTDPACGTVRVVSVPCDTRSVSLDFLEPGTTYYWFASYGYTGSGCSSGGQAQSAAQSFTTAAVVGVEAATWGRVKSLYRE